MHDFSCPNPADMNFKLMKDTTSYYKENPKGVEVMCRAFEEVRDEARVQTQIEMIRNLIDTLKISTKQAMELLKISSEDQQKILAKI